MNRYYRGRRARRYNKRWRRYSEQTLSATTALIDTGILTRAAKKEQRPPRVLDVACGTGLLLHHLGARIPGLDMCGVDASADMLAQAREHCTQSSGAHLIRFVQADLNRAGWVHHVDPPSAFDLITCTNALHTILHPAAFLAQARELVAPGGHLVVEDFAPRHPFFLWAAWESLLGWVEKAPVHALTLPEA